MAPTLSAKSEREKKLKSLLSFTSRLPDRVNAPHDALLQTDLRSLISELPLPHSVPVAAKQEELDRLGTELWNLSTSLRRKDEQTNGKTKDEAKQRKQVLCLLRVFAFLLLDTASGQTKKAREGKHCLRLLRVALKAARMCIEEADLGSATKVLERAADYQEVLGKDAHSDNEHESVDCMGLRAEYFGLRMALAWRQDRMDTAEHMFAKSKQLSSEMNSSTAESLADLMYEMGRDMLRKRHYELAVRWLERAYDVLGEQDIEVLGPEAGELRLGIMQTIVQTYMKLKSPETQSKAWEMVNLLETDYSEKMVVQLLKLELLAAADTIDSNQYYAVLLRMIRTVVLNETNFKTIMHHIHKLRDHSTMTACKVLDDFIDVRLFREENQDWIEKAVITRIWAGTTGPDAENSLDTLQDLFENVGREMKYPLSPPATHAAQTLLWKRVETAYSLEQYSIAEAWCRICLHPIFDKAGQLNRSKIARKVILCAINRQDYADAREMFSRMSDTGRDEPITRYLTYKVALHSKDTDLAAECLDIVCRKSMKDATVLYACVLEAQSAGDRRQTINALEKVLDKYDYSAPEGVHLPALLRCTARSLTSELIKDGKLCPNVMEEICKVFEGACTQSKSSRRRPTTPVQQLFTPSEFEWFSKSSYNLAMKYCAEMPPTNLVRLLTACAEFIKLLKEQNQSDHSDLSLRLMFCDFLSACTYTTLARAEDNIHNTLQCYLQVRKHCQNFRQAVDQEIQTGSLSKSTHADMIAKHFQIVKLELEATLKLENWDALDELLEQCWKYDSPEHLETLADLVLVIHSCVLKANVDRRHQARVLKALQKIITLTWRQTNNDVVKTSRWLRCLFQLALSFDESISFKCLDQASQIASPRQGVSIPPGDTTRPAAASSLLNTPPPSSSPVKVTDDGPKEPNHYPPTELEWLATTSFNHAIDYYMREDDSKCRMWAEKAISLAQWAEDGGALRELLMKKFSGLVWKDDI